MLHSPADTGVSRKVIKKYTCALGRTHPPYARGTETSIIFDAIARHPPISIDSFQPSSPVITNNEGETERIGKRKKEACKKTRTPRSHIYKTCIRYISRSSRTGNIRVSIFKAGRLETYIRVWMLATIRRVRSDHGNSRGSEQAPANPSATRAWNKTFPGDPTGEKELCAVALRIVN